MVVSYVHCHRSRRIFPATAISFPIRMSVCGISLRKFFFLQATGRYLQRVKIAIRSPAAWREKKGGDGRKGCCPFLGMKSRSKWFVVACWACVFAYRVVQIREKRPEVFKVEAKCFCKQTWAIFFTNTLFKMTDALNRIRNLGTIHSKLVQTKKQGGTMKI